VSNIIKTFYFIMLSVLSVLGAAEIIFGVLNNDKNFKAINLSAYILHSASVLLFIASNQPYAAAYLFALFIAKIIVNFKSFKLQKRC